jgi:hypothetical protein
LSISFVLFAGWFSASTIPLLKYPSLILSGFFSFFGSLNVAVPFLLDQFRIPSDTFQLFLATSVIRNRLPDAQLTDIEETTELIDVNAPYDAYLLPAERGSALTMLNPRFTVVIPDGATVKMPLAYPIAGNDPSRTRFVNTWIGLKEREGFVDRLYDHWILGKAVLQTPPRWSIVRNVLHWVP